MDSNLVVINKVIDERLKIIGDPSVIKDLIDKANKNERNGFLLLEVKRLDHVTDTFNFSSLFNDWKIEALNNRTMRSVVEDNIDRTTHKIIENNNEWEYRVYIQIREARENHHNAHAFLCTLL